MTIDTIITALKNVSGPWNTRVYRDYPPSFVIYPVAAIYTLFEPDISYGDGKGMKTFKDVFNIDVWTKGNIETCKSKMRTAMYALGVSVQQANYREIPEIGGITHLVFEYEIIGG